MSGDAKSCALCGVNPQFEKHYGPELGLCNQCADAAANLYSLAHSGEYLTWGRDERRSRHKKPVGADVRWQVLRSANFTCAECGDASRPMHVDHITPRALGGSNDIENLQALCDKCNLRKGAR